MTSQVDNTKNFYQDALRCPYVKKTISTCPFISKHVDLCPFLNKQVDTERAFNDGVNLVSFYNKTQECPYMVKTFTQCPFISQQLNQCPYMTKGNKESNVEQIDPISLSVDKSGFLIPRVD